LGAFVGRASTPLFYEGVMDTSGSLGVLDLALPEELLLILFSFVPPADLIRSRSVCRRWNALSRDQYLWKEICERVGLPSEEKPYERDWEWYWRASCWELEESPRTSRAGSRTNSETHVASTAPPTTTTMATTTTAAGTGDAMAIDAAAVVPTDPAAGGVAVMVPAGVLAPGATHGGVGFDHAVAAAYAAAGVAAAAAAGAAVTTSAAETPAGAVAVANMPDLHGRAAAPPALAPRRRGTPGPGVGFRRYANGDFYRGELLQNKRHGLGVCVWADQRRYQGLWKEGKLHGFGTYRWPRGDVYTGEWTEDRMTGYGAYSWPEGDRYVGAWVDMRRHGFGKYVYGDGRVYVGEWRENRQDGRGVQTWPRGDRYDGEWENDTRTGYGLYVWEEGDIYSGGWMNGLRQYYGRYEWPDGRVFHGFWSENHRNGEGVYYWPDGSSYSGSWHDNRRHGHGRMVWADGSVWQGEWDHELRVGAGMSDRREWDGFFLKSIPEQRQFMKAWLKQHPSHVRRSPPAQLLQRKIEKETEAERFAAILQQRENELFGRQNPAALGTSVSVMNNSG
jgi:hypothetical protein